MSTGDDRLRNNGSLAERAVLASSREDAISPDAQARLMAAVLAGAASGAATTVTTGAATKGLAAAGKSATFWITGKWAALAVVACAVGGVLYGAQGTHDPAVPVPTTNKTMAETAPAPSAPVTAPRVVVEDEPARPAPAARPSLARTAPRTAPFPPRSAGSSDSDDASNAELQILEHVRTALETHAPQDALARLDAYERAFPHGQFADEAQVLRIDALVATGARDAAAARAASFVRAHPASPYAVRLRRFAEEAR
jgi:hypothetical protein